MFNVPIGAAVADLNAHTGQNPLYCSIGTAEFDANGSTLWRVRAGPEVDRGAADKLRASIKDKLKLDGMIVTQ